MPAATSAMAFPPACRADTAAAAGVDFLAGTDGDGEIVGADDFG